MRGIIKFTVRGCDFEYDYDSQELNYLRPGDPDYLVQDYLYADNLDEIKLEAVNFLDRYKFRPKMNYQTYSRICENLIKLSTLLDLVEADFEKNEELEVIVGSVNRYFNDMKELAKKMLDEAQQT